MSDVITLLGELEEDEWNCTALLNSSALNSTLYDSERNITYSPYYQHSPPVAAFYIVSYLFIFLLCMVGNALVCLIVMKNKRMRTVTNLFILNLAISDLLVGIFCIPTTLVDNLITGWPYGNVVCKLSGLVQGTSVSASVFTLVAIAVDRFRCIVHPFKPKLTLLEAGIAVVIIWVLAVAIMCPSAVMLTVSQVQDHYMVHNSDYNHTYPLFSCFEDWPDKQMRRIYTTVLFGHIYLAPLTLIVVMYSRIGVKLYESSVPVSDRVAGRPHQPHAEGRNVVPRKKIKVIKMLIMVALLFMLSWLPLWTLMLLTDYATQTEEQLSLLTGYIFPFAHWLAFSNSSVNPIVYGYFNENFKRGFQAAFRLQWCSERAEPREAYSHRVTAGNVGNFGVRNKVYTDGDCSDSDCLTKESRMVAGGGGGGGGGGAAVAGCSGQVHGGASSALQPILKQGLNIEDIEKITPLSSGVCQAWEG
ncbi:neuropeptide FF receptor 2 [Acipenser ruthenus]|uniref:neuropeptide FF receptor 2 n=1 Tax=Acipenser ruthenus TaxID=7906 RepID=UPI0027415061|nr:neuropeptide FF receptor 2 [Acipenser ruthenus]